MSALQAVMGVVIHVANHDKRDELPLGPNGEGEPDLDTLWCWYESLIDFARSVLDAPPQQGEGE